MAEEWILENAHLRMCVSSLGGKVQSLFSRQYQAPVLYENPAGGMFPMLPLANRVAGNRFIFHGQEIVLPRHHADEYFFLHGDGWLQRWDIIEYGAEYCVLQLRRQHACGFDYLAQLRYQLLRNQLIAELTLTHYGEVPALYGCGFHPFFPFAGWRSVISPTFLATVFFCRQQAGYSASAVGYLWSLGVVAEVVIFALSKKVFRRFSARDLLLLSAVCGLIRWGLMGWTTALPGLILAQILHCGTFTVCHLAAMRYIAARQGSEVIRLQAVYSAVAMGGSIAIMTVFAGFLYQHLHQGVFWVMALLTLPAMAIRPKAVAA